MVGAGQDRLARSVGPLVGAAFAEAIAGGVDIRPTIAITKARLNLPEILAAMGAQRLAADGGVLTLRATFR